MTTFVIIAGVVAVVAVVTWFVLGRGLPVSEPGHPTGNETTSQQIHGERPAGPDVEPMDPDQLGGDHRPPS